MASWGMPVIRKLGAFGIDAAVSPTKGKQPIPPFYLPETKRVILGVWESLYNKNFKIIGIEGLKQAGLNAFTRYPQRWVSTNNAMGLTAKSDRYGGACVNKILTLFAILGQRFV